MKNKIHDIISKILTFYKSEKEISLQKIVFLIYLCDWKNSIEHGRQMTDIEWKYLDSEFSKKIIAAFNEVRTREGFEFKSNYANLSETELQVIDFIGTLSLKLNTEDFIKLVFSTYPMIRKEKYKSLNLPDLAEDYKSNYAYLK